MTEEEFKAPAILPPYDDGIFQSLLTRPKAEPVLRYVITGVLEEPVEYVIVRSPQLPIAHAADKNEILVPYGCETIRKNKNLSTRKVLSTRSCASSRSASGGADE